MTAISEPLAGLGLRQGTNSWLEQQQAAVICADGPQHTFTGEALGGTGVHFHLRRHLGHCEPSLAAKMLEVGCDSIRAANVPDDQPREKVFLTRPEPTRVEGPCDLSIGLCG